jgi:hypothetical protein
MGKLLNFQYRNASCRQQPNRSPNQPRRLLANSVRYTSCAIQRGRFGGSLDSNVSSCTRLCKGGTHQARVATCCPGSFVGMWPRPNAPLPPHHNTTPSQGNAARFLKDMRGPLFTALSGGDPDPRQPLLVQHLRRRRRTSAGRPCAVPAAVALAATALILLGLLGASLHRADLFAGVLAGALRGASSAVSLTKGPKPLAYPVWW